MLSCSRIYQSSVHIRWCSVSVTWVWLIISKCSSWFSKSQKKQRLSGQHPLVITKARVFQKKIYFCLIDYSKNFVWIIINVGKFWNRWEYQSSWLASWEASRQGRSSSVNRTRNNWFRIGKAVCQGCILSLCLFNFYAEYLMRNTVLHDAQAGIKIASPVPLPGKSHG